MPTLAYFTIQMDWGTKILETKGLFPILSHKKTLELTIRLSGMFAQVINLT